MMLALFAAYLLLINILLQMNVSSRSRIENRTVKSTVEMSTATPTSKFETALLDPYVNTKSPVSLESIFKNSTSDNTSADSVVLITTGDVMLGRSVNYITVKSGDFTKPWEKVSKVLVDADIVFINLEGTLLENCPLTNRGMRFCGDLRNAENLTRAGVDIANLANNHMSDYGSEGVGSTINALNQVGVLTTGRNNIVYKNVKGVRFSLVGFNDIPPGNPQISSANKDVLQTSISDARDRSDVVVVAFHWGNEYTSQPTKRQRELAHLAVDSGADVVVGNHPHWIQPIETYKDKVIIYSHGNFIFDQLWSLETRQGIVCKFTFWGKKLVNVDILPIQQDKIGQPYFLTNNQKEGVLNKIKKQSFNLVNPPKD